MRVRKKIKGTAERPRLNVYRSNRYIYAQLIDDTTGNTVASASSYENGFDQSGSKIERAQRVGALIAERAKAKGFESVVFDRGGYLYHGRVKALADGAREGGLKL
jgi:large subunit ribosomal protein L18